MSIMKTILTAGALAAGLLVTTIGATAEEPAWTKGVVKKVDTAQSKVTVKHEPITNLGMPSMTMIFFVPDHKVLEKIREGDAKEFAFGDQNGRIVIENVK